MIKNQWRKTFRRTNSLTFVFKLNITYTFTEAYPCLHLQNTYMTNKV